MTLPERLRPTIRVRLTLLYGGVFLVGGVVLLTLTYLLVQGNLPRTDAAGPTVGNHAFGPTAPGGKTAPGTTVEIARFEKALVAVKGDSQEEALDSLLTQGGIALAVVGAIGLGFGWLIADRALRPVHRITETARRVANGHNLTERIAYAGPRDDVKELADTFDVMLGRLARAFDGQRRFVDNASHELRTPLAINRTLVDVAVRRADATDDVRRLGESLLIVNGRHERLIDGLLMLAGSEHAVMDRTPLDLADVAARVLDQAAPEAAAGRVRLGRRDLRRAPTEGDPVLLERLVQNLVENAVRHNHEGGEVGVVTGERDGRAELAVSNTGPIVPGYEVETIFEPFRRLGTDRVRSDRGSGLGLSIVRATATAHGGTVTAEPLPGGGLTVTVRLPAAPPGAPGPRAAGAAVTRAR